MLKKIAFVLMPLSLSLSVALADSLPTSPVMLTSAQMDQVTAGSSATVNADATAISSFFVMTHTNTAALTAATSGTLGGYVEVAGGQATATAAGQGSSTSTDVSPATSSAGSPGSLTFQAGGQVQSSLVNINGNAVLTIGSSFVSPL